LLKVRRTSFSFKLLEEEGVRINKADENTIISAFLLQAENAQDKNQGSASGTSSL
jgi:hypothetical protein